MKLDRLLGHGGLFKTPVVGQKLLAGALGVPVSVMATRRARAAPGAWPCWPSTGCAACRAARPTLDAWLDAAVFAGAGRQHPDAPEEAGAGGICRLYP